MSRIRFVQAEARDAESILGLSKELIDNYEDTASIDYEAVLAWMRRKIERGIGGYTRILSDEQLVGWYRLFPRDGCMELDDFYLLEGARGQGIGTQVLQRILDSCRCDVMLFVFIRNARVMRWYERSGFRVERQVSPTRCIMVRKINKKNIGTHMGGQNNE